MTQIRLNTTPTPAQMSVLMGLLNTWNIHSEVIEPHKPEEKTYTLDEAFQMVENKLNKHYGTNLKIL